MVKQRETKGVVCRVKVFGGFVASCSPSSGLSNAEDGLEEDSSIRRFMVVVPNEEKLLERHENAVDRVRRFNRSQHNNGKRHSKNDFKCFKGFRGWVLTLTALQVVIGLKWVSPIRISSFSVDDPL
ncbi:hypothetical protein L596_028010 [Steinernema carpocapsae]|uniref:Uncharacterized protein n=1 Tax=Steinernema carpocapsae TaxID=34508 RepID=A0A4U5LXB2_STECR|nr:hypothetical protein L596_028010 [Steinernema carpocapsae]